MGKYRKILLATMSFDIGGVETHIPRCIKQKWKWHFSLNVKAAKTEAIYTVCEGVNLREAVKHGSH